MTPTTYIGMRQHHRLDGSPFLAGVADIEFVVPAGATVHLRRMREHDDDAGPAFVLAILPPDPRCMTTAERARVHIDNAPALRHDVRDDIHQEQSPC